MVDMLWVYKLSYHMLSLQGPIPQHLELLFFGACFAAVPLKFTHGFFWVLDGPFVNVGKRSLPCTAA